MYMELGTNRAETVAARIADAVGSWWSLLVLLLFIVAWTVVSLVVRPVGHDPASMISYLGTALTAVTALQGPLILLTQRREAARDRERDVEAFHVAVNTETDLHAIRSALEELADSARDPTPEQDGPTDAA